ncbi:MAG: preprotein translocase subunit SecG [Chthoniobacterales bacterium]|nr:preprotein translocase subunit SecG [Chthoniobacterales bacterium]
MSIMLNIVLVIYLLVALLMVFVILMQRPKSEGLGAAFGGGMTDNLFGAQTTNVLTKITAWLAGLFFVLTFVLSLLYASRTTASNELRQELMRTTPPAAAVPASPAAGDPASPVTAPKVAPDGTALAPAPAGTPAENLPQVEGAASPTAADLAVGAVQPIPAPATTPAAPTPTDRP